MTRKQAEWAGMAPSVAGGWVRTTAVNTHGVAHDSQQYSPDAFPALIPDSWGADTYIRQATQAEVELAISEREKADALLAAASR